MQIALTFSLSSFFLRAVLPHLYTTENFLPAAVVVELSNSCDAPKVISSARRLITYVLKTITLITICILIGAQCAACSSREIDKGEYLSK